MLSPSTWRTRVTLAKAVAHIPKIEDEDYKEKQDSEMVEMLHWGEFSGKVPRDR
jgi:hypothetical protein